ncbi:MAG: hypothetical protein E7255_01755 [Lachnospiraceae bacterium]|jgi:flagellar motility protein MotE (MotC chaperone)|nr:hypothetical protein [Lachnospiraceae bacterium]
MARKKQADGRNKKEDSKVLTIVIALLIVIIWLAIFALLIKLDIGGFGSGVLRPILKDVPIIHRILPDVTDEQMASENNYSYSSLPEAVARIKELELMIEQLNQKGTDRKENTEELQAEINRLKGFEEKQAGFEERQLEFDKKVVFNEKAPDLKEYKAYYEKINPTNAEIIYRQVVEQLEYADAILEKADIYRKMEPKAAADILETMSADIESVAQILLSMKPAESAKIMAEMDSVFAAKVTKKMLDMDKEKLAD